MLRMTAQEVVQRFEDNHKRCLKRTENATSGMASVLLYESEVWREAASVVRYHLKPRWHVPDQEGLHWLEELAEEDGPKQVRLNHYNGWVQFEWKDGDEWRRVTGRVCKVSGRPGA